MLLLLECGSLLTPSPQGKANVLIANERILHCGKIERKPLDALKVPYETIDLQKCVVVPGLIDVHQHLAGGSGEGDYSLQSPRLFLEEIVLSGITTVVGVLGTDTTMRAEPALLGQVKSLRRQGLQAYMWSGGYTVPPATLTSSIREDLLFIEEVIGAGEIAISDDRSLAPDIRSLAQLVHDTHVGGLLSGKAGVTHFHIGKQNTRLAPLRALLNDYAIEASWLYPTHITRTKELVDEAVELAQAGAFVDTDTIKPESAALVRYYLEQGGPPDQLTLSSDSGLETPHHLFEAIRRCVLDERIPLETVIRFVTSNCSRALKLRDVGHIAPGMRADILALDEESFEIVELIAGGRRFVSNGKLQRREDYLEKSSRSFSQKGKEA